MIEIDVDRVFLFYALTGFCSLRLAVCLGRYEVPGRSVLLISLAGALLETILPFVGMPSYGKYALATLIWPMLMVVLLRPRECSSLRRLFPQLFLPFFLVGAAASWIRQRSSLPGAVAVPVGILAVEGCRLLFPSGERGRGKVPVGKASIHLRLGEREVYLEADALVDTGNTLREPISGRAVCVLKGADAHALCGDDWPCRVIPYRCVDSCGILRGYSALELVLEFEGEKRKRNGVYIGMCEMGPKEEAAGRGVGTEGEEDGRGREPEGAEAGGPMLLVPPCVWNTGDKKFVENVKSLFGRE